MIGRLDRVVVVVACFMSSTCGPPTVPSSSIVGDWSGRVIPLHFAYLEMRFTQQGSSITGIACYMDPEGSTDGKGVVFSNAPVVIDNPQVSVSAPWFGGPSQFWFRGQFQLDGTISGLYATSATDSGNTMSLMRGGNYCGL